MQTTVQTAIAVLLAASVATAADLQPPDRPIEDVIDHYIDELIKSDGVSVGAQADDLNAVRRITLDLAGRIPSTAESQSYQAADAKSKRTELVDRLLASPDFVWHQRNELDAMLLPNRRNDGEFRKYLLWAVEQSRPWDDMFRDMVTGDGKDENMKAATQFVRTRIGSLDDLTNDTARLFFGVNVSCAQCHDHPLVEDWKQDHYFGMQTFFKRTYQTKKGLLGERFYGDVKFKTTAGVEKQAVFMFLTGSTIEDKSKPLDDKERKKHDEQIKKLEKDDKAGDPPKAEFSPREQLVELVLRVGDNHFFARCITNRVWARLLGRGIVHPPDQMHTGNPPSHPDLLDWLTRDMISHGYDLKRLIRGIALSQAYSRSSEWTSSEEPPDAFYFALATPRVMSPRQYGLSLLVASQNPEKLPSMDKAEEYRKWRENIENSSNGWAGRFEVPRGNNFQVSVDEALMFSNDGGIEGDLLRDSGDRLLGFVKQQEELADGIQAVFWAVCSRPPTEDEATAIREYIEKRPEDERPATLKQAVWALLTGPEIRFNY
jgi:hypothetical protein